MFTVKISYADHVSEARFDCVTEAYKFAQSKSDRAPVLENNLGGYLEVEKGDAFTLAPVCNFCIVSGNPCNIASMMESDEQGLLD